MVPIGPLHNLIVTVLAKLDQVGGLTAQAEHVGDLAAND